MMKQQNQKPNKSIDVFITRKEEKHKTCAQRKPFTYWLNRNRYYHKQIIKVYQFTIPCEASVLHVNGKNGYLLHALDPSVGVVIDDDLTAITEGQKKYPHYQFYEQSLQELSVVHQFDYIVLSFVTMETDDIQTMLQQLHRFCHAGTRIIIESYSYLWEPVLWFTKKLGLRRPTQFKNWVSRYDLRNFLYLAGFDVVSTHSQTLLPIYIPLVSFFFNSIVANIPLINRLCLNNWTVVRPKIYRPHNKVTVSVIIPCKNEAGNIEAAVKRCPQMGSKTELVFIEGNSTDTTLEEIKRVARLYPEKNIKWFVQDGKGKGDAVRKGFAHATGDVLMILDADLTTQPEELPKFFDALVSGKGEFVNGSRLVYGMEQQAMMFLAFVSNYFFSVVLSWILGQKVKDTLCGTKVLWKKDYELIAASRAYFGLQDPFGDFDLLFGAARLNLKIVDIPVHYKRRMYGKTNIRHFKEVWFLTWMSVCAAWKFKVK